VMGTKVRVSEGMCMAVDPKGWKKGVVMARRWMAQNWPVLGDHPGVGTKTVEAMVHR
jgi:hypothetical protein